MQLRDAARQKAKIRIGLSAISGGGKTYTALLLAYGITGDWTKIAVVDSENNSADLYEHLGNYKVLTLEAPFSPERYIEAIDVCVNGGMEVIIVDSISHEWEGSGGMLEIVDKLGNEFQGAWKKATPRHEAFKRKILFAPCHMITTVRRKQDYILQEKRNKAGNVVMTPVKNGFKEVTREGWEYELTINLELDIDHYATANKDRTNLFMGQEAFIPTIETGQLIRNWCEKGFDPSMELKKAIADLVDCNSIADLTSLKSQLPYYVVENEEFKNAGLNRYNEIKAAEVAQSQAQPPASETPVAAPVKPGSLGTEIKDGNGLVIDIAKLIQEASTVDKVNSIRSSLIKKQDEGYDVKDHITTLHDRANRELNLIFLDKEKRFSIFQAKEDAKGVNVLDANGKLVDLGAKIAAANTIPAIDTLLDELRKYNLEGYDMGLWVKTLHDRATNTLGFRYNSTQKKYYVDVTKGITAPVPA